MDRFPLIEKALQKQTKSELAKLLMPRAREDVAFARDLERAFEIEKPVELLVNDVGVAIANATDLELAELRSK